MPKAKIFFLGLVIFILALVNGAQIYKPGAVLSQLAGVFASDTLSYTEDYSSSADLEVLTNATVTAGTVIPTGSSSSGEVSRGGPFGASLLAALHFNDGGSGTGSSVADSSGNGRTGTLGTGVDCTVTGKFGRGCRFDGTGGISLGTTNILQGRSNFTVSLWAKLDSVAPTQTRHVLFSQSESGAGHTFWLWAENLTPTRFLSEVFTDNGNSAVLNGNPINDFSSWHQITAVYDGSKSQMYVDGVLQNNQPVLGGLTNPSPSLPLMIGHQPYADAGWGWKGVIDEVAIWGRALSANEVAQLYSGVSTVSGQIVSKAIDTGGQFSTLGASWVESGSGTGLEISTDGGRVWCSLANNSTLSNSACSLPATSFKYRITFSANTALDRLTFNWTRPVAPPTQTCGNNLREGTEVCDGTALANRTCSTEGYQSGSLSCSNTCQQFVTTQCIAAPPVSTATIYVDSNLSGTCNGTYSIANRNCSGSDGVAYKTIQQAANVVVPGSLVYVRSGRYANFQFNVSGTAAKPIVYQSYPYDSSRAIIDGGGVVWAGIQSNDGVSWNTFSGFEIRNFTDYGIYLVNSSDHNTITNNIVHDITGGSNNSRLCIEIQASDYFTVSYNEVYNCRSGGISTDYRQTTQKWSERGIFDHNLIHNVGLFTDSTGPDGLIGPGSRYTTFEYNIAYNNADDGIDISAAGGQSNAPMSAIVRYNVAFGNAINPATGLPGNGAGNGIKISTNAGGDHQVYGNISFANKRGGYDENKGRTDPANRFYQNVAYGNGFPRSAKAEIDKDGFIFDSTGYGQKAILYNNIASASTHSDIFNNTNFQGVASVGTSDYNLWSDKGFVINQDAHSIYGSADFSNPAGAINTNFTDTGRVADKWEYIWNQVRNNFALRSTSAAIDRGTYIAGFHCPLADDRGQNLADKNCYHWRGSAPDLGAIETGTSVITVPSGPPVLPPPPVTPTTPGAVTGPTTVVGGVNGSSSGGGTSATTTTKLTKPLFPPLVALFAVGQKGAHVTQLQQMLAVDKFYLGPISGSYDKLTVAAVQKFQTTYGLLSSGSPTTNGFGLSGPKTRAKLNQLYAQVNPSPSAGVPKTAAQEAQIKSLQGQLAQLLWQLMNSLSRTNP